MTNPLGNPFGNEFEQMRHPEVVEARMAEARHHARHRSRGETVLGLLGALIAVAMLVGLGWRLLSALL